MDEIIEPEIDRIFALLVAEDDFSAAGSIDFRAASVGGEPIDMSEVRDGLEVAKALLGPYLTHDQSE